MLTTHPKLRVGLYVAAVIAAVIAPVIAVTSPDYGTAITTASGVLMAAAGVTAAANVSTSDRPVVSASATHLSDDEVDMIVAEIQAEGDSEDPVSDEITDEELAGIEPVVLPSRRDIRDQ